MVKGICMCGDFEIEITGSPAAKVACHCIPCRKTSGTTGSYNVMIPNAQFKVIKGIPKQFTRQGDSGKDVTYNNCPICSCLLFVEAEALPDAKIVKLGSLEDKDFVDSLGAPQGEIYCKNMCAWEKPWEGAQTKQGAS